MKLFTKKLALLFCSLLCQISFANPTGNLFKVSPSGSVGNIDITLCLNINTGSQNPLSCQKYNVSALSLSILTVAANHTYPFAGIKINSPDYTIKNLGIDCKMQSNDYCLFSVSDSLAKVIVIKKTSGYISVIAAGRYKGTDGYYPLLAASSDGGASWAYTIDQYGTLPKDYSNNASFDFNSTSCSGAICIVGGTYRDSNGDTYPLLATSSDSGANWTYPIDQGATMPANYKYSGVFYSTSCAGANCIAGGKYRDSVNNYDYPLLATSSDSGASWTYTIQKDSPTSPGTVYAGSGQFNSVSCAGVNCIAGGGYNDNGTLHPLLATSHDSGATWAYKIDKNYPTLPPYDFADGTGFNSVSCAGTNCIAVGQYRDSTTTRYPLLATSHDSGDSWTYTIDKTPATLPADYVGYGTFTSAKCTGATGANCIAGGIYYDSNLGHPMLATSTNSGATWTYAIEKDKAMPADYDDEGEFKSVSCDGANCIAAGVYYIVGGDLSPFLATSSDSGVSWIYTIDNTNTGFPADYYTNINFNSTSCAGTNCIVAGSYYSTDGERPLLATSSDSGASWTYTIDNTHTALPSGYNSGGEFKSVSATVNSYLPDSLTFIIAR